MKKFILLFGFILAVVAVNFAQTAIEWNQQGVDNANKFDYTKAYECFTKAIELKADFGEAYYNRATVWFKLPSGTYAEMDGCEDFKKAKSLGFKVKDDIMKNSGCL